MDFERIYEYRFKDVIPEKKQIVWKEVSEFIYKKLNSPDIIVDPAAGMCEFINNVPSTEKWAVDINEDFLNIHADINIHKIIGNNLTVELPENYFDGVFISNFLEHLANQQNVASLLKRTYKILKTGGRIAIIGPNFKYTTKEYFDFADHSVILSELSLAEHLYGAGYKIIEIHPRFLPLSFRSNKLLPVNSFIIKMYLKLPFAWKFFGKQFLLIAEK
jgi:ubiquinone/menaquinone biosynthesis C-methylase UbiE